MAYLGKTPSQAVRSRYYYTATGGETSLSGADDNSNVLTFTDGNYVDVSLNGATLVAGSDYNTTTTNTIGGLAALTASDIVEVLVYDTFSVFGGNMAANLNFKDNIKANFGTGNDLQIFHDGSNSIIRDAGTGSLKFQYGTSDGVVFDSSGNVGIGTTSSTFTAGGGLNVVNGTFATIRARGGSSTGIDFAQDSSSNGYLYNRDNASIIFGTNNTERLRIDSSGSVGINTTTMNAGLNIKQSADNAYQIKLEQHNTTDGYGLICDMTDGALAFSRYASSAYTERMRIDSSGNVMIGTTSSSVPFYVYNTGFTGGQGTANTYTVAQVQTSTNTSGLWFGGMSTETTAVIGTTTGSGNLAFQTYNGSSWGERMRIDSSGNVGIGSSTPAFRLAVEDGTAATRVNVRNNANAAAGSGIFFEVLNGGSTVGNGTIATQSNGDMAFFTGTSSGTERWRINTAGHMVPANTNNGIILGSTASVASNLLNDYEEGTWTPTVGGTATYLGQSGRYVKIGGLVHIVFDFTINAIGTGNQSILSGLPYAAFNTTPGSIGYYSGLPVTPVFPTFYVTSSPTIQFAWNTSGSATIQNNGSVFLSSGSRIIGSCTYRTN